ncbi:MAG: ABC transporter ATP-binding protein [Thermoleophilia bacterium]|nr:ABC transporter ATP-binding protein [Thermoleophilia bacterium]
MTTAGRLLEVEELCVEFRARGWHRVPVRAVDGVSFSVSAHETVALVGESGSGKSTIGRAILGLVRPNGGSILLDGRDVTNIPAEDRGAQATELQVVFQDPFGSLNPARTIGRTLTEPLEVRGHLEATVARGEVTRLLNSVGLPADAARCYPYVFSGGQRQRIAIARALAASPRLVICDEATSALDVITRRQILELLITLSRERGIAFLFIAHDIPVVRAIAERVVVLYRGRVMEQGPTAAVVDAPLHPYTKALIAAAPVADPRAQRERVCRRAETFSTTCAAAAPPPTEGCPFAPRCPRDAEVCWAVRPADVTSDGRTVACHLCDHRSGHPEATKGRNTNCVTSQ